MIRNLNPFILIVCLCTSFVSKAVSISSYNIKTVEKTCTSITVTWNRGDGSLCLVTCRESTQPQTNPDDGIGYSASNLYGHGSDISKENYCVYFGNDSMVKISGLNENTSYTFVVFELDYDPFVYLTTGTPSYRDSTQRLNTVLNYFKIDSCMNRNKIVFQATSNASFNVSGYEWVFHDTNISGSFIAHHVKGSGKIPVQLKVSPDMGCMQNVLFDSVFIYPGIVHGTIKTDSPACTLATFRIFTEVKLGAVTGTSFYQKWILDDTENFNTSSLLKTYSEPGDHRVKLIYYTYMQSHFSGCTDTIMGQFHINATPIFQFSYDDTCIYKGELLILSSPARCFAYEWNSHPGNIKHIINDTGVLHLKLIDSTGCGFMDSILVQYCPDVSIEKWNREKPISLKVKENTLITEYTGLSERSFFIVTADGRFVDKYTFRNPGYHESGLKPGIYLVFNNYGFREKILIP